MTASTKEPFKAMNKSNPMQPVPLALLINDVPTNPNHIHGVGEIASKISSIRMIETCVPSRKYGFESLAIAADKAVTL